ncbi:hypothetical protein BP5796_12393 [Coleophoma crateriformis]|uniref:Uncharacterized protein n=1 Tax=Coleophoma crateriformis TaxID=565419 RepID=A0A3D8Q9D9_9HELO|nr:hypothetical protein BP5796_12393 [Coleophoma crateriformis]
MEKGLVWIAIVGISMASAILNPRQVPVATITEIVYESVVPCAMPMVIDTPAPVISDTPSQMVTLAPNVHWSVDTNDVNNLIPSFSSDLYYASAPTIDAGVVHDFAVVNGSNTYPAIVLDHSSLISSIQCGTSKMVISFSNSEAFSIVQNTWTNTYLIITSSTSCQTSANANNRGFFIVNSTVFKPDLLTVVLDAITVGIQDALSDIDVSFGSFSPTVTSSGAAETGSFPSNLPTPVADSTATSACDPLPAAEISGFPAAACGATFDADLDATIGFFNFDVDHFSASLEAAAPGLGDYNVTDYQEDDVLDANGNTLQRRQGNKNNKGGNKGSAAGTNQAKPAKNPPAAVKPAQNPPVAVAPQAAKPAQNPAAAVKPAQNPPAVVKPAQNPPVIVAPPAAKPAQNPAAAVKSAQNPAAVVKPVTPAKPPTPAVPATKPNASPIQQKLVTDLKKANAQTPIADKAKGTVPVAKGAPKPPPKPAPTSKPLDLEKLAANVLKGVEFVKFMASDPVIKSSVSFTLPEAGKYPTVESPFGSGYQLYESGITNTDGTTGAVAVYCIECSAAGALSLNGKLSLGLSVTNPIKQATIVVNGNIQANFGLGVKADGSFKKNAEMDLGTVDGKSYSVDNIIQVVPRVGISAVYDLDVQSPGSIFVSASATLPDYSVTLDFANFKNSKMGDFKPTFNTSFDVEGQISAKTASLSLPIRIGVAVKIISLGNAVVEAFLVNKPLLEASTSYTADSTPPAPCNNGVSYSANFSDASSVELLKQPVVQLAEGTFSAPPIGPTCKSLGAPSSTTSSSSTSTFSTSTTSASAQTTPTTPKVAPGAPAPPTKRDVPAGKVDSRQEDNNTDPATADFEADSAALEATIVDDSENGNGFTFSSIYDSTGQFVLVNDDYGNFAVKAVNESPAPIFASYQNVTISDDADRLMFYYPDIMDAYGVSRFRMNFLDQIPVTSDFITFVPINDDGLSTTPGAYVAVDSSENVFFTVVCFYQDQIARIFIVQDIDAGIANLQSPDLTYIVTGGVVTQCAAIDFVSDNAGI